MKIALVQFDPHIGDLKYNIDRVDSLLKTSNLEDVQLLVGPELAFTGYNFPSLQAISDFLEPTCGGPTAWWAAKTAKQYGLLVSIGYPEITKDPKLVPERVLSGSPSTFELARSTAQAYVASIKSTADANADYWTFNSTLTVGPDGSVLAHYRKTHLYYTDATWACPSIDGFLTTSISFSTTPAIKTSFAICMDLNPKAFTAGWKDYEVANHALSNQSSLLVISTAWMTLEVAVEVNDISPCCPEDTADQPDMDSLTYWMERLIPLIKQKQDTIVIIANRTGNEEGPVGACDLDKLVKPIFMKNLNDDTSGLSGDQARQQNEQAWGLTASNYIDTTLDQDERAGSGAETNLGTVSGSAHYAGTSTILTVGHGKVSVYGVLGRGVEKVLVVNSDTQEAAMKFEIQL